MKTYFENYRVLSRKAGKQLRKRFNASTAWFGTADIVREYQNPDGPQTVVTALRTPYFASQQEAGVCLTCSILQELNP